MIRYIWKLLKNWLTTMQKRGKTPEQQLTEGYRMLTFQPIEKKI